MSTLSISKAWDETKEIIARDGRLLVVVALAFVAVPVTVVNFAAPIMTGPQPLAFAPWWIVLSLIAILLVATGMLAMATLAIRPGIRVAEGVERGFRRLLPFCVVVLVILFTLSIVAATIALKVTASASPFFAAQILVLLALLSSPLLGRLSILSAVAAGEDGGPVRLVRRSWLLGSGSTLRLWGLFVLLIVAWFVIELTVILTFGSAISLALGPIQQNSEAKLLMSAVMGVVRTGELLVTSVILARIYVQLAGRT